MVIPAALNNRIERAWHALAAVTDPEIPVLSIEDLGIIRQVVERQGVLEVDLLSTYSGCPATDVISMSAQSALRAADLEPFRVRVVLAPAWSSDFISAAGRARLKAYGVAPPQRAVHKPRQLFAPPMAVTCPRCESVRTECLSEFGSTPCKALYRCLDCLEPFDYFKCL
jgi:ring-1,2-phenylacetyl-CoA epoxidase subunit PaaD